MLLLRISPRSSKGKLSVSRSVTSACEVVCANSLFGFLAVSLIAHAGDGPFSFSGTCLVEGKKIVSKRISFSHTFFLRTLQHLTHLHTIAHLHTHLYKYTHIHPCEEPTLFHSLTSHSYASQHSAHNSAYCTFTQIHKDPNTKHTPWII